MLRGFATTTFHADDLAAAKEWYTELLGQEAYYAFPNPPEKPAYIEFRIGDDEDELGFIDRKYAPAGASNTPGGAVTFWHVDDLAGAVARLVERGATVYEEITERGAGFNTASVVDPFGNVLGVMNNPHWAERHAAGSQA